MSTNVLTIVYDKAEQKLDTVIAAAVNELGKLGHVVKEVRVMGDSGEAKVALNTIEGILPPEVKADATAVVDDTETAVKDVEDVVENKAPDGTSPVSPTADSTVEGAPVDTPTSATVATPPLTVDEKREALLAQLEALDKEEEAEAATSTTTTTEGSVDPTNSGEGTTTPTTA